MPDSNSNTETFRRFTIEGNTGPWVLPSTQSYQTIITFPLYTPDSVIPEDLTPEYRSREIELTLIKRI